MQTSIDRPAQEAVGGYYEGGKQRGFDDARIFPGKVIEWYEVLKDVPDHLLPLEVRGYRDGLKEGLAAERPLFDDKPGLTPEKRQKRPGGAFAATHTFLQWWRSALLFTGLNHR